MTIPRVLLALALLVIGGMLWGLHKDIYSLKQGLTSHGATVAERIDAVNDNINHTVERLMAAISKPPQVVTKTQIIRGKPKIRYLKPRVHKRRHPTIKLFNSMGQPLEGLFMPESPAIYSTPPPP